MIQMQVSQWKWLTAEQFLRIRRGRDRPCSNGLLLGCEVGTRIGGCMELKSLVVVMKVEVIYDALRQFMVLNVHLCNELALIVSE